ncbi:MAG: hypothetical protein NZ108_08505, partial [Bacteroidia bacterium]|nr:hypothetical protein [Bacteroidia bacterium]
FFCGLLVHIRYYSGEKLRLAWVESILLISGFAAMTNLAVSHSLSQKTLDDLFRYAKHFANPRDLILEYEFEELNENILTDVELWDSMQEPVTTEWLAKFSARHLQQVSRQYECRVFVYNAQGARIDLQSDIQPIEPQIAFKPRAFKTLSPNLFLFPYPKSAFDYVYVGRIIPPRARKIVELEFHPRANVSGKLYPQLLLDKGIRQRLTIPSNYEFAIYKNRQLVRKQGDTPFPIYESGLSLKKDSVFIQELDHFIQYTERSGSEKTLVIRAPKRDYFAKITAFSFLFYYYFLLYLLLLLPGAITQFNYKQFLEKRYSFTFRIQLLFVLISFLPLLTLWILTTSLFRNFYSYYIRADLFQDLRQVSTHLSEDRFFIAMLSTANQRQTEPIEARIRLEEISNLLSVDINVFDKQGKLFSTTRPRLFQTALFSLFMNPDVYQKLTIEEKSEWIILETIGTLSYTSGYIPLYNDRQEVTGFLNLPYLAQQDLLEKQIQQFIAYLVNFYIILFLFLFILSLFITKTLTHPLRILKINLEKTTLGLRNNPIEWKSKD